jgi:hypothetical protein
MVKRMFILVFLFSFIPLPVEAADATYVHSEGFSILVPDGWDKNVKPSGVNVIKGQAFVSVFVVYGSGSSEGLRDIIASQMASQYQNWQILKRGGCQISGINGACGLYTGVNQNGDDLRLKISVLGKDGKGYIMFVAGPRRNIDAFSQDLNRIDSSFSLK